MAPVGFKPEVDKINAKIVAQYLIEGGFTAVDARNLKEITASVFDSSTHLESMSMEERQASQKKMEATGEVMDIIIEGNLRKDLTAQWYRDSTPESNEVRSIALNSQSNFYYYRERQSLLLYPYDWGTDFCSSPFFIPRSTDQFFANACVQHDFGYRNGKIYSQTHNLEFKSAVDYRFLNNMYELCASAANRAGCNSNAYVYYSGVSNAVVDQVWLRNG